MPSAPPTLLGKAYSEFYYPSYHRQLMPLTPPTLGPRSESVNFGALPGDNSGTTATTGTPSKLTDFNLNEEGNFLTEVRERKEGGRKRERLV